MVFGARVAFCCAVIFFAPSPEPASALSECAKEYELSTKVMVLLMRYDNAPDTITRTALWQQAIRAQHKKEALDETTSTKELACDHDTESRYDVGSGMFNLVEYRRGDFVDLRPQYRYHYEPTQSDMNVYLSEILEATGDPLKPPDYSASLGHFSQIEGFTPDFYRQLLKKFLLMYRETHTALDFSTFDLQYAHAKEKLRYWIPDEDLST